MRFYKTNLQLFAADTTNHLNVTTDTRTGHDYDPVQYNSLAPEMKTFYDMTLIDEAYAQLVHDQFGQKRPIPQGGGKTIEFRKFSSLPKATTALTEGVTPVGKRLDVTSITATVAQYGDYITQSDVLELTALDNTILEATKLLGKQAGLTLDTIVRNVLVAGTNVSYCPTISGTTETAVTSRAKLDSTSKLTVKTIQKVVAKLRGQNAPTIGGKYVAIIHPYVAYDLMRDPEWIDAHKYANPTNLYEGEIGEIAGVRFVQTTEAKVWRGDNLASDSRTILTSASASAAATTVSFDGGTVAASSLKGRTIVIDGVEYTVSDNTTSQITLATGLAANVADNTTIYPGSGASDGSSVFATLIMGEGAYGVTEITGGGLQTIVKQKGSSGTADPLDQRSSVGWKAIKTAELLVPNYLVRVESTSPDFATTAAN